MAWQHPHFPPELENILHHLAAALTSDDPAHMHIVVPTGRGKRVDLSKEQARYKALIEQIPAITFTVDLQEGIPDIYVGPQIEQILGFSQKEWMEDPILWFDQCHPEDRDIWHQEFSRGIQTGGPFRAECRVFAKDGHIVWLHGEARLVRDEDGNPLFIQGIAFDITEQKKAEQQLRQAQEIKVMNERLAAVGQMAASIGHDLRNPLAAIRNAWLYISKKMESGDFASDKRVPQMAQVIERELKRSGTIISELLQFSRDREPYRQPCPVAPLVDEAISVITRPSPTMRVMNEVPEDLAVPNVDIDLFRQVVVNLVQNAVEAIGPEGKVWIRAHKHDKEDAIVLEIVDNGKGIAPELRENIWKPLFTTKAKGTGLGLPIVANVVQRHEGTVFMESAPGRGATFRVQFPIGKASEGPPPQAGGAAGDALLGNTGNQGVKFTREIDPEPTQVDVHALIEEVLQVVQRPAPTMQLLNLVPPGMTVEADRGQLRQVLVNLVQNGVEAIGPDGWVKVRGHVEGERIVLEVIDNGTGVALHLLDDIWKPLFTTKTRGTGLGLPVVRNVIGRHSGTIDVETAVGKGATFRMELPQKFQRAEATTSGQGTVTFQRDVKTELAPVNLHELVDEVFEVAQKPAASMQLVNTVPANMVELADRDQLRQALVNLVQNALEAIRNDGNVTVTGRAEGGRTVIEVTDNGTGIPPKIVEEIWKPLFTTKARGTGLGLPTVQAVARRHGGDVRVESSPGLGSKFRFELPRKQN